MSYLRYLKSMLIEYTIIEKEYIDITNFDSYICYQYICVIQLKL
jgi:hypothetical protein